MAIEVDSAGGIYQNNNITSKSWTHVTTAEATYMIVGYVCNGGNPGANFNGDGATRIIKQTFADNRVAYLHVLAAPDIGSYTVAVASFTSGYFAGYSLAVKGVDLSDPIVEVAGVDLGITGTISLTIDALVNGMAFDAAGQKTGIPSVRTITPNGSQAQRINNSASAWVLGAGSSKATTGSTVTMIWTGTAYDSGICAVSLRPIVAADETDKNHSKRQLMGLI